MPRLATVALLTVASFGAAGCGSQRSTPTDGARAAAETLVETCARGDPDATQDLLSEPLRRAFLRAGSPARGCQELLGVGPVAPDSVLRATLGDTRVADVVVRGGYARVKLDGPGGPSQLELELERGEWLVGA